MKIKTNIFILLFVSFPFVAKSQISTDELPISFKFSTDAFRTNQEKLKTMPPIDIEKLMAEDEENDNMMINYYLKYFIRKML